MDRHYNFVHNPDVSGLTEVDVFDVAPPWPAWLAYNVQRLDETGMFGELMMDFKYNVIDLKHFEDPRRTTIFPCRASGLNGLFLDSLDEEPSGDIKLVGCNTSKLVFEARYPVKSTSTSTFARCPTQSPYGHSFYGAASRRSSG